MDMMRELRPPAYEEAPSAPPDDSVAPAAAPAPFLASTIALDMSENLTGAALDDAAWPVAMAATEATAAWRTAPPPPGARRGDLRSACAAVAASGGGGADSGSEGAD